MSEDTKASSTQSSIDALTEFQGGRTVEDPEIGPDDNTITSPWSEQVLAERIANGEGEQVRQELAEAAKGLQGSQPGEGKGKSTTKAKAKE